MDNAIAALRHQTSVSAPTVALGRPPRAELGSALHLRQPAGNLRRSGLLLVAVLLTFATAVIYLWGVADADQPVDALTGWLLRAAGILQAGAAVALVARPARRLLLAAAGADVFLAVVWAVSRAIGLPFGPAPWSPWQLGTADLTCTAFELLSGLALAWLAMRPALQQTRWLVPRTALPVALAFVPTLYLGFVAKVTADVDIPAPAISNVPITPGQMATFTYCTPGQYGLAMDFYAPVAAAEHAVPVLLQIHGGVGIYGDRKDVLVFRDQIGELNAAGFAVASIDYRRAPIAAVMANQVEDAKCAVRFLRANAEALGIDPSRIGVYGHSEGGWLAAMLGLAGPPAGFETGQYLGYSSQVQAVVDEAGPTDLPRLVKEGPSWMGQLAFVLYHGHPLSTAPDNSAVDYVRPGAPPFLILQGTDDEVIPFQQSVELVQGLQVAGDSVRFVPVANGPHPLTSDSQTPTPSQLAQMVTDFFVASLHPAAD